MLSLFSLIVAAGALLSKSPPCIPSFLPAKASLPDLYEASIAELQNGLTRGHFTSVDLVKAYFARIEEVNLQGPALHAVIELNPSALRQAAALDFERKVHGARPGGLHGIPILLKDNIATVATEGMNTTAGSFALLGSIPPRDSTVVAKLRKAGAILLGKANLSEWANFRGSVPSGFSGRGGQATSPYFPNLNPSGSSSGSAIAAAIGLAAGTLGSETDGSIMSPSSRQNVVGLKPTVGRTSRAGVIPISSHQDSVGPIVRSVADAAMILTVIAGRDPLDNFTLAQPLHIPDFTKALKLDALRGVRLGVPRALAGSDPNILRAFNQSLAVMESLGATIIDPADLPSTANISRSSAETTVLDADFKVDVNKYISSLLSVPTGIQNLTDLIQFNIDHADEELIPPFYTSQSIFITSDATSQDDAYFDALATDAMLGRTQGIDAAFALFNVTALVLPSGGAPRPAAIAGYPGISVPLGFLPDNITLPAPNPTLSTAPGQPFGVAFLGTAFTEFQLIGYAYAYEQASKVRLQRKAFNAAIPKTQLHNVMLCA